MRIEGRIFAGTATFFALITAVYWFTSYERTGAILLLLTAGLGLLPGAWLLWWSRRMAPRPEDRGDAAMADWSGDVGSFPSSSGWPVVLAAGAVLAANGLAFGIWPAIPGAVLLAVAATGATLASRRQ